MQISEPRAACLLALCDTASRAPHTETPNFWLSGMMRAGGSLGGGLAPDGQGYQRLVDEGDVNPNSSQHAGDAMAAQTESKPGAAETDDPKVRESALCRLELGDYAIEDVALFERSTMLDIDTEHALPRTLQESRAHKATRVSALVYSPDNMTLVSATGDKILLHPTVRAHARDGILPTRPFTLAICSHVRRPNMRMQVDPRPERPGASMKSSVETTEEASSGGSSGNSISCDWDWDANNKDCKVLSLSSIAQIQVRPKHPSFIALHGSNARLARESAWPTPSMTTLSPNPRWRKS